MHFKFVFAGMTGRNHHQKEERALTQFPGPAPMATHGAPEAAPEAVSDAAATGGIRPFDVQPFPARPGTAVAQTATSVEFFDANGAVVWTSTVARPAGAALAGDMVHAGPRARRAATVGEQAAAELLDRGHQVYKQRRDKRLEAAAAAVKSEEARRRRHAQDNAGGHGIATGSREMAEASAAAPSELSADDAVLVELMQRRFDARTAGDAPTTHALREQIMGKFADKRIAAIRHKAETEGQDEGASLDDGRTPPRPGQHRTPQKAGINVGIVADWVSLCRGADIPRGARQRITFEGRLLLVSRTRSGKVTVEDVEGGGWDKDKYNYSRHVPGASRGAESLKSWPAREAEGFIKVFLGRPKAGEEVEEGSWRVDANWHEVSPRCIEKFLNVELSSGVSRFNMPHDAQEHLSAAEHLLARAKQNNSDDLIEVASAEGNTSDSGTVRESIHNPCRRHAQFLGGPVAEDHWKRARAVTAGLQNSADEITHDPSDSSSDAVISTRVTREMPAPRTTNRSTRPAELRVDLEDIKPFDSAKKNRGGDWVLESIPKKGGAHRRSWSAHPNVGRRMTRDESGIRQEQQGVTSPISKAGNRRPLRPIAAVVNSPARRRERKKTSMKQHVERLRNPVGHYPPKWDHLQDYRDSLPDLRKPSRPSTQEENEALKDTVENFQRKFRESILSGLVERYHKRIDKKADLITKLKSQSECMAKEVAEYEGKEKEIREKLEMMDSKIEGLKEQARPLEERVRSISEIIEQRASKGRSERLLQELKDVRIRMNTLKGNIKVSQADRQRCAVSHKFSADKLSDKQQSQRKHMDKINTAIEEEATLKEVITDVSKFMRGEWLDPSMLDHRFPEELAAAIKSIQQIEDVQEENCSDTSLEKPQGGPEAPQDAWVGDIPDGGNVDLRNEGNACEHERIQKDWRVDPSVWNRRIELAMKATSPRWRDRILEETRRWQLMAEPTPERKRPMVDDQYEKVSSPTKKSRPKSPCTKTFTETHAIAAKNFESSFLKKMAENCREDWKMDFSKRMLLETVNDHRSAWWERGLPCDRQADEARLREIRKDRQHPLPEEDLENFRRSMAGKWKNLEKVFNQIDQDGSGKIDVHEFSEMCSKLKLGWSEFQIHRVFKNAAGSDMQLDFVEFYEAFAPPRATSETKMLFHNKIPFLILEPEAAVEDVVSALTCVFPAPKPNDFVYQAGVHVHEHMYFILKGQVKIMEANGMEIKICGPGDCFGELAVMFAVGDGSNLGHVGHLRRESAQALTDCVLYTLAKRELDLILPRYPRMRQKLFNLSAMHRSNIKAQSRGLCPTYPHTYVGGTAYTSGLGLSRVQVEPKRFVPLKLRDHEHLRSGIQDTDMGWPSLTLESSINENVPDKSGVRPNEGKVVRSIRNKVHYANGIEATKIFEEPTPAENIDRIQKTYGSKFFRIQNLRKEGMSYVDAIR